MLPIILTAKLHLPRFVREQDVLSFTVQVNNTGTAMQKGKVQAPISWFRPPHSTRT